MKNFKNHFSDFHPATLLLYFVLLIISVFICGFNIILVYAFISFSICIVYTEGIKPYIKSLVYYMAIMAVAGLFNCIFNHTGEQVFLYVNDVPLTLDAFFYGIYTGIMVSCLLMWFKLFNHSIDNGKLNYIIGNRLPVTGLIISMTFSFVKRFRYKLDNIRQALFTLGITGPSIKNASITLSTLLNVMLKDAVLTADSMTARGYGSKHRRLYKRYRICIEDIIFIILSLTFFILSVFFKPALILLILAQFFYNIYKEISWKYYQSKI